MKKYILAFACLLITACSQTKIAVQWADTFLAWEINDTFDLDSTQKKHVRPEIDEALGVTKKELFPEYSRVLLAGKADLEKSTTLAEAEKTVAALSEQLNGLIKSTLKKVKPQILKISDQIEIKNWEEFKDEYQDRTEDLAEEKGNYNDKFKSRMEDWVGALHSTQIKSIEDFKRINPFPSAERIANRTGALEKFEKKAEITKTSINKEKFRSALSEWVDDYEAQQTPAYLEATKKYRASLEKFLAGFYLSLDQKQKTKLFSNIEKRAKDLADISEE